MDDHEDTIRLMVLLLRRKGFVVTTATSIEGALEWAAAQEFDVLVSDLSLPDGSGLELLGRMAKPPAHGAIMVSGYATPEDVERSKAAGYKEHLSKPVGVDTLVAMIQRIAG